MVEHWSPTGPLIQRCPFRFWGRWQVYWGQGFYDEAFFMHLSPGMVRNFSIVRVCIGFLSPMCQKIPYSHVKRIYELRLNKKYYRLFCQSTCNLRTPSSRAPLVNDLPTWPPVSSLCTSPNRGPYVTTNLFEVNLV